MTRANMNNVVNNVWVGGDLHPNEHIAEQQVQNMVDLGIRNIMDLRYEWNDEEWVRRFSDGKIAYFHLGIDDHGGSQPNEFWEKGLTLLREWADAELPSLVHCHMGVNRAPSLVATHLCEYHGFHGIEAWEVVKEARPQAWSIYLPDGLRYLGRYEEADEVVLKFAELGVTEQMMETIGRIRQLENKNIPHTEESYRESQ